MSCLALPIRWPISPPSCRWLCLWFRRVRQMRQATPMLRVVNQFRQPLELSGFLFGADHPPDGGTLVRGRLRLEVGPRGSVGAELALVRSTQRMLILLEGIDARARFGAPGKGRQPRWAHAPLRGQFAHPRDVHRAPDAGGLARRETGRIALGVQGSTHAVNPAEAQRLIYGFGIADARSARLLLVVPEVEFGGGGVVRLQPRAKVLTRVEEGWFSGQIHRWPRS